jgi:hypothetical protein
MRLSRLLVLALATTPVLACATADRGPVTTAPEELPATGFPLSVVIEHPDGRQAPMFAHAGATFVAGEQGERYGIRLINRSARRVEAVISVDGRDVISGELGDFKTQRGYVVEPFGSIVVEGFRQSLDHVAAFRFTPLADSYSARRGTPQHVGVIGIAAFEERESRSRRNRNAFAASSHASPPPPPTTFSPATDHHAAEDFDAAPAAQAPAAEHESRAARSSSAGSARFAPPAGSELGTRYGETTTSQVREVEFKRRRKRQPDLLFTLHYDSLDGLAARGVPVHGPTPVAIAADPFPASRSRR